MKPYGTPSHKFIEREGRTKQGRAICWAKQVPVKAKARRAGKREVSKQVMVER
jgi:hypothetical protein